MAVSRYIVSATASTVTVQPVNETYPHPRWGTVTRNVTVINSLQGASFAGRNVNAYWSCEINFRLSYITAGGPPRPRQIPFYHEAILTVP